MSSACYPTKLFAFGDRVDVTDRRGTTAADAPLPSVELGVRALDGVAQGEHRIEHARADGRTHGVRQIRRCLARDFCGESLSDLLRGAGVTIAQQRHELVAAPAGHDVRLTEDAL